MVDNRGTYESHYKMCRQKTSVKKDQNSSHSSVYDVIFDDNFLEIDQEYHDIIESLSKKVSERIENMDGCKEEKFMIQLNDWRDIEEVHKLADYVMPQIERKAYLCDAYIEFALIYRNLPSDADAESSWLWHYDDCPKESIKLMVYLSDVTEDDGPFTHLVNNDGGSPVLPSTRLSPWNDGKPEAMQIFPGSRIPPNKIEEYTEKYGKISSFTGKKGAYALFTPNQPHKATKPEKDSKKYRDALFFIMRPSLNKRENYIDNNTGTFDPPRNVKMYDID